MSVSIHNSQEAVTSINARVVMDATSTLRALLLLGGNLAAGPFVYWLHIRADVRQEWLVYHRAALLFSGGALFGMAFVDMLYSGSRMLNQIGTYEKPVAEIVVCIGFAVGLCLQQLGVVLTDWAERRRMSRSVSATESTMLSSYSENVDYGATESACAVHGRRQEDKPLSHVGLWASLEALGCLCVYYTLHCLILGLLPDQATAEASDGFKAIEVNTVLGSVALAVVLYSSEPQPAVLLAASFLSAVLPAVAYTIGCFTTKWSVSMFYAGIADTFCCGVLMCASVLGVVCPYSRSKTGCNSFPPAAAGLVCAILVRFALPRAW
ncbi:hypothetical protein HPB52_016179 [Rhipicephalus sanguineus]|uniref:Uncharacterized protein n=1 Tax=Rhipicephalus sanguineus TaxID=34632 RepID=A0A9D4Q0V4_RHISA|nr:hypothetical protein HPB52_016179 [Rhipicephalus sanguineus]